MRSEREQIFYDIYKYHLWGGISRSGTGSDLGQTKIIRRELPNILNTLGVQTMLDIPCGDLHWMKHVMLPPGIQYIGADIVAPIIAANRVEFPNDEFHKVDIVTDALPPSDLVLTRDLFGHLNNEEVRSALRNIKDSGAKYLLATTFPAIVDNKDVETGKWRAINMDLFDIGPRIHTIDEELILENGKNIGKMLGLYELS